MTNNNHLELVLSEIDLLKTDLQLYHPDLDQSLQQALAIEYTFDSNQLEGIRLSFRETEMVICNGLMHPCMAITENLAALNHYKAINFIQEQANDATFLTTALLKQLHAILSEAIQSQFAGTFRTQASKLINGKAAPKPEQLPELIAEHLHWLNLEGPFLHPVLFAAEAHLRLLNLQPFPNLNGLCARLTMNLILLAEGYPLANISSDSVNRAAYFDTIAQTQTTNDQHNWQFFIAEQVRLSCQNVLSHSSPSH